MTWKSRRLEAPKKAVFGLVATVVFFATVELALTVVGVKPVLYAEDPYVGFSTRIPLFVEETGADGKPWMATARNKLAIFNPQRFPKAKRNGAYRIFCIGGSTTYGRPYDDSTSFCGWLRELLPAADPSREWEVVNAGGISYASYRVALLMEELVRYEPDLFVVYSGHNEFLERRTYGAMLESPPIIRGLDAWLSRSRTYSVIKRAIKPAPATASGAVPRQDLLPGEVETLLDHSVGPEAYRRDDALQDKVLAHYRFNLARIIDIARSAGSETILVAPASNLSDSTPFKTEHDSGLGDEERRRWDEGMQAAEAAYDGGQFAAALNEIHGVLQIDARHAGAHFLHGRVLQALGRYAEARKAYARARDEDVCPLRALTPMHGIVEEVAVDRGVAWVDFADRIDERSQHGLPGKDFFLDHVHPTIDANGLLALAILDRMQADGIVHPLPDWGDDGVQRVAGKIESRVDRAKHAVALRNLANVLSWAGKVEEAERLARRATELAPDDATAHNQLGLALQKQGDALQAEEQFRRALAIRPGFAEAHNNLGVILENRGNLAAAAEHYEQAVNRLPGYDEAENNLALALMRLQRFGEAEQVLERMLEVNPDHVRALCNMATLRAREGDLDGAAEHLAHALRFDPSSLEARNNMGIVRFRQGEQEEARAHFEEAVRVAPNDPEGHNNLGVVYENQGNLERAILEYERAVEADPDHAEARANLARVRGS